VAVTDPEEPEIIDEIAEAFAEIDVETRRRTPPLQSGLPPRPESDDDWGTPARMEIAEAFTQIDARRQALRGSGVWTTDGGSPAREQHPCGRPAHHPGGTISSLSKKASKSVL
jgi:hypothetical protein